MLAASSLSSTSGRHLLERVRQLHPHAGRALLVPANVWSDQPTAEAIRDSMALGRIDYYVPRPARSLDEVFHEAVSSFLLEWARDRRVVPQTVHIVGETWSGRAYELREVFEQCVAPHAFCLAASERGRELLARAGPDAKLPLMVLPDGRMLSDPSNAEIAEVVGAPAGLEERDFDVVIVGSGPAGLSAAVYGASEGLRILVVDEGGIGGQARSSSLIRNYLGFAMGVSGSRLAEQAYDQAVAFGASFLFLHRATALARSGHRLTVSLEDGRRVSARAVILATGATYRRLDVPSLETFRGAGVFYGGPVSEAPALKGKDAYIAGGGNSAGQAALHLARYARRVTLVVRAPSLAAGMSHYLVRALEATPNVEVRAGTTVVDGGGDGRLQRLVAARQQWRRRDGRRRRPFRADRSSPAHRLAVPGDRKRRVRVPPHRSRSGRSRLAARTPAAVPRNEHARRAGGGRRSPRLGQAGGLRGWRRRDRRAARPRPLGRRATAPPRADRDDSLSRELRQKFKIACVRQRHLHEPRRS